LSLNPNYRQAHLRLAYLLQRRLGDPAGAAEHFQLFRELRTRRAAAASAPRPATMVQPAAPAVIAAGGPLQPEEVVIVSGLPRSGTSMLMQMLVAGGISALTDGIRAADDDNPRGYLEFEAVKEIRRNRDWLDSARGKAVKVVAPLLPFLPDDLSCRVVFVDRNLDEILASQRQMLINRGVAVDDNAARNSRLKAEYGRVVLQAARLLEQRPNTRVLRLQRSAVLTAPREAAARIDAFLGGGFDVAAMAAEVRPSLHRQRA
jgi:hypothetical protein